VSHWSDDPAWSIVRPPLVELSVDQRSALVNELEQQGFAMPGLDRVAA
jgi:hypothetical protein